MMGKSTSLIPKSQLKIIPNCGHEDASSWWFKKADQHAAVLDFQI